MNNAHFSGEISLYTLQRFKKASLEGDLKLVMHILKKDENIECLKLVGDQPQHTYKDSRKYALKKT